MSGAELGENLDIIGWSARHLARKLEEPEQTVRRMLNDEREVPASVAQYVRVIAAVVATLDTPVMT